MEKGSKAATDSTDEVSSTTEAAYMSNINYSNGANEGGGQSGTKPRKGVQNEPKSSSAGNNQLSGSKPRKGVQEDATSTESGAGVTGGIIPDSMTLPSSVTASIRTGPPDVVTSTEGQHSEITGISFVDISLMYIYQVFQKKQCT